MTTPSNNRKTSGAITRAPAPVERRDRLTREPEIQGGEPEDPAGPVAAADDCDVEAGVVVGAAVRLGVGRRVEEVRLVHE